jgi:transposase
MALTEHQYGQIAHCFPVPRGNVSISNLTILNAILHIAESNCHWRKLPRHFGNWHTIYTRVNRWSKNGVLDRVFVQLQTARLLQVTVALSTVDKGPAAARTANTAAVPPSAADAAFAAHSGEPPRLVWLPRPVDRP